MGYIRRRRLNQAKTKKRETAKKIEENRTKTKKIEKKTKKIGRDKIFPLVDWERGFGILVKVI